MKTLARTSLVEAPKPNEGAEDRVLSGCSPSMLRILRLLSGTSDIVDAWEAAAGGRPALNAKALGRPFLPEVWEGRFSNRMDSRSGLHTHTTHSTPPSGPPTAHPSKPVG